MDVITPTERDTLKKRLEDLITNRPVITQRIKEAKELGDLKENAEYHSAREQQGLEEAEIRRLEHRLQTAHVVDASATKDAGVVFLGSRVRLRELDTGDEDEYLLVGEATGSLDLDYVEVTVSSPMGDALMKCQAGEVIAVKAPRGTKKFEIVEIL